MFRVKSFKLKIFYDTEIFESIYLIKHIKFRLLSANKARRKSFPKSPLSGSPEKSEATNFNQRL